MSLQGKVIDLSGEGWGVVRSDDGKTYFVKGAWPGDEVEFEALQPNKKYSEAVLVKVLLPSPDRRGEIPCEYQGYDRGTCGGCPWMIASYESQLSFKQRALEYLVDKHEIRNSDLKMNIIWPSPTEFSFRNRAQFKTDGRKLGFVSLGSNAIVDVKKCEILNPKMQSHLTNLHAKLPNADWNPSHPHHWNFIDCDDEQIEDIPLNQRLPFKQGNTKQNQRMKDWFGDQFKSLKLDSCIMELYAGSGNFTEELLKAGFDKVVAVENSELAISQLREKKHDALEVVNSDLSNAQSFEAFAKKYPRNARYLFLDPPREGANGLEELVKRCSKLEKIFYVSCDSRTWVRDVQRLQSLKHPFQVSMIQPVDQFPHTPHLEILSILERIPTDKS